MTSPPRPGSVPDIARVNPSSLVVCKPASKPTAAQLAEIQDRLATTTGDELAQAQKDLAAWERNTQLFDRCCFEHIQDAVNAADCGADGVIVSNHGGRMLDSSPAPIEMLPHVVDAAGKRLAVLVDSGFRRGADVVKALALGAKAVLDANGGGGDGGQPGAAEMVSDTPGAGAGGGSGGAILLQARVLTVEPGALIVANGGGGGGGATRTGEGMQAMVAGKAGQDGQLSAAAANGGSGAGSSLAGGFGGAKDPPGEGGRARQRTQAAGGGGGSAGRIRIETAAGPGPRAGLGVSPSATYGTVLVE